MNNINYMTYRIIFSRDCSVSASWNSVSQYTFALWQSINLKDRTCPVISSVYQTQQSTS